MRTIEDELPKRIAPAVAQYIRVVVRVAEIEYGSASHISHALGLSCGFVESFTHKPRTKADRLIATYGLSVTRDMREAIREKFGEHAMRDELAVVEQRRKDAKLAAQIREAKAREDDIREADRIVRREAKNVHNTENFGLSPEDMQRCVAIAMDDIRYRHGWKGPVLLSKLCCEEISNRLYVVMANEILANEYRQAENKDERNG